MSFRRAPHPASEYHELIIAAAHRFGRDDVTPDAALGAVRVGSLGSIALSDAQLERLQRLTPAQRIPMIETVVTTFLSKHQPPLSDRYDVVPEEYRGRLRDALFQSSLYPNRPGPQHRVANLERALGIDGWKERLLHVGGVAERIATETGALDLLREAATSYWEAGDHADSRRCAEMVLARVDRRPSGVRTLNPQSWVVCESLIIVGRPNELASLIDEFGQAQLGPDWWPVCQAAAAVACGDLAGLRREVEAAERLSADEPLDAAGYGLTARDRAAEMRRWLTLAT